MSQVLVSIPSLGKSLASGIIDWLSQCHGFLYNGTLMSASLCFVLYLMFQSKKSYGKLSHAKSYVMISYYSWLWLVSLLNLTWSALQVWECAPGKEVGLNALSLFTTSGMLFLEVSLLAFLLQGNYIVGLEALSRPFAISACIVGLDVTLKAFYMFVLGIPLFINNIDELQPMKWNLWVAHRIVLTAFYGTIFLMYCSSRWKEKLPAKPAFFKYIAIMLLLNAIELLACALIGSGIHFGFWLNDAATVCYHVFYLPLIYITFLSNFFKEEDLHLDHAYFSELKDAGFFDAEWD